MFGLLIGQVCRTGATKGNTGRRCCVPDNWRRWRIYIYFMASCPNRPLHIYSTLSYSELKAYVSTGSLFFLAHTCNVHLVVGLDQSKQTNRTEVHLEETTSSKGSWCGCFCWHLSAITVFTHTQANHTNGENSPVTTDQQHKWHHTNDQMTTGMDVIVCGWLSLSLLACNGLPTCPGCIPPLDPWQLSEAVYVLQPTFSLLLFVVKLQIELSYILNNIFLDAHMSTHANDVKIKARKVPIQMPDAYLKNKHLYLKNPYCMTEKWSNSNTKRQNKNWSCKP